jgi:hypothetical protein
MAPRQPASFLTLALALASLAGGPVLASQRATVQEILDGRELYIAGRRARVKQVARAPQQVWTGDSRGQLSFDSGAAGRLNRFSRMKLGSDCFLIERGQILVSGRQNGCTRSARLSVRGTNYVLAVDEAGELDLAVLEGSVAVEAVAADGAAPAPPTVVGAGQRLRLSPTGVVLSVIALTSADYTRILNGPLFRGYRAPLPAYNALRGHIRRSVPGVTPPTVPAARPALPRGLPRLF